MERDALACAETKRCDAVFVLERSEGALDRAKSARTHESLSVTTLLDSLRARGFVAATAALDKGYDAGVVLRRSGAEHVLLRPGGKRGDGGPAHVHMT